jgi:hypothetical protein
MTDAVSAAAAERIYRHAQDLLKLAHICDDAEAAEQVRQIAHALLEIAYQGDPVLPNDSTVSH